MKVFKWAAFSHDPSNYPITLKLLSDWRTSCQQ